MTNTAKVSSDEMIGDKSLELLIHYVKQEPIRKKIKSEQKKHQFIKQMSVLLPLILAGYAMINIEEYEIKPQLTNLLNLDL